MNLTKLSPENCPNANKDIPMINVNWNYARINEPACELLKIDDSCRCLFFLDESKTQMFITKSDEGFNLEKRGKRGLVLKNKTIVEMLIKLYEKRNATLGEGTKVLITDEVNPGIFKLSALPIQQIKPIKN